MLNNSEGALSENKGTGVPLVRPSRSKWKDWLAVTPFFLAVFLLLVVPSLYLFLGSFQDAQGGFTLQNIRALFTDPLIKTAYVNSIRISIFTALVGGVLGFLMAYAVTVGGLPNWMRAGLVTFAGVASNYGAVPLAFLFINTLGRTGLMTAFIALVFQLNLYDDLGFNLYTFWGVSITYLYFQLPLMILITIPILEGLKKEWREACESLGASQFTYWRRVAFPILLPSLLGTMLLLFGNSFGAYATAYALTGGLINLATILIGQQIYGDVLHNVGLGYALAVGMVVIMAVTMAIYYFLRRYSERWLQK
jgi:putative spermidine/putrescine transport system permease protein